MIDQDIARGGRMDVEAEVPLDRVEEASQESFPASDAPAWTVTGARDATLPVVSRGITVVNNESARRFELRFPEGVGSLRYRYAANGDLVLVHTEVPQELEGRGHAGQLARAALEFARSHDLHVVPLCPFVRAYLKKHSEFQSLVRP